MNFNGLETKLVMRILKTVLSRMEGRTKEGLWDGGQFPAYHKETILPHRSVMIDLTPAELARLERMVAPGRVDPLTAREEGLCEEISRFVSDMQTPGRDDLKFWLDRFSEIRRMLKW